MMLTLLAAAAAQKISPDVEARVRAAFDPRRLAAAERLREANGSEATLQLRIQQAVTRIIAGETADCVRLAADLPKNRQPDCAKVYEQQERDTQKIGAVIPAMVEQMRQIEQRSYAERYTVEEMEQVIAFMKSPAGQKFAAEASAIDEDVTVKLRLLLRTTLDGTPLSAADSTGPKESQ